LGLTGNGVVQSGQTLIRFETAGQLDFQNVSYLIVFNTSGNGQQPFAQGPNTNYTNWSVYFIIGGGAGFANSPGLEQVYLNPANNAASVFNVTYPTSIVNFQPSIPSGNAAFGFQITFNRCVFDLAPPTNNPSVPVSANGICPPFANAGVGTIWNVSLFTLDRTLTAVDSLSVNGPSATDYNFQFDVTQVIPGGSNSGQRFKPANNASVSNPAAQITGIEIFNTP
jgi:hypothetical protein